MFWLGLLIGGIVVFIFKRQIENLLARFIRFIKKEDKEIE
jgi:hypothetical protein